MHWVPSSIVVWTLGEKLQKLIDNFNQLLDVYLFFTQFESAIFSSIKQKWVSSNARCPRVCLIQNNFVFHINIRSCDLKIWDSHFANEILYILNFHNLEVIAVNCLIFICHFVLRFRILTTEIYYVIEISLFYIAEIILFPFRKADLIRIASAWWNGSERPSFRSTWRS